MRQIVMHHHTVTLGEDTYEVSYRPGTTAAWIQRARGRQRTDVAAARMLDTQAPEFLAFPGHAFTRLEAVTLLAVAEEIYSSYRGDDESGREDPPGSNEG